MRHVMVSCSMLTIMRHAPRCRLLACVSSARRHAVLAPTSPAHSAWRWFIPTSKHSSHLTSYRRTIAAGATASALDEFELDDEEPIERRQITVGPEDWAKTVHAALSDFLNSPEAEELDVFLFKTYPDKRVEVRIDKLTDKYGSPNLGDLQAVGAAVNVRLLEQLGEDAAGEIEVAVSSPGAERPVEWDELERFSELPLWVVFTDNSEDSEAVTRTHVLEVEEMKEGAAIWKLSDVKANSPGKGRKMNKKMREQRWTLGDSDIQGMRIYVDF
eukprot:jgi/Ulvmu1/10050/UM059_0100.1